MTGGQKIDVSVAYAVWSGIGVALIASIGVLYFREPITLLKLIGRPDDPNDSFAAQENLRRR